MVKEYGYEYDATLNEELFNRTKNKVTQNKFWNALCLRSGRDALKTIAREFNPLNVFIPALACDSMICPFQKYNHNVIFYRLKENYSIDIEHLRKRLNNDNSLFLYMDYFGIESISDDDLFKLKNDFPKICFIEDRTHNLLSQKTRTFIPDFTVASLRKWVNIPDGGLLWTQKELQNNFFSSDIAFSKKRLEAQCKRNEYFFTENQVTKDEYRKIFSTIHEVIDNDNIPARMSEYSYNLATEIDWKSIKNKRKRNAQVLIDILKKSRIKFIQDETQKSDLYVPFLVDNRNFKQSKLSSIGIFNTIIWPLSEKQKIVCGVSKYTEEHMLAAPCDQRYTEEDMEYIGWEMVRIFNE